jgi:sigma-B regulation protein RsbU (phosphoserine phosphatase)
MLTVNGARRDADETERIEEHGVDGNGFPLGIMPDAACHQVSVELEPGDAVKIYSDGVTDTPSASGEKYDSAEHPRLRSRLSGASGGPKAIGQAILRDLEEFSAGTAQFDDMTLIRFGPAAPAG